MCAQNEKKKCHSPSILLKKTSLFLELTVKYESAVPVCVLLCPLITR